MTDVQHRRPRILICDKISDAGLAVLAEDFDVDVRTGMTEDELVAAIPDYEGVIVRSATKITARVLDHAERLKVIARAGAGLDTIDVAAAVDRGVEVVNSPDANTLAVAELTVGLLVALARSISRGDAALKQGRWIKTELMGSGLAGKTLGIVGFGRIGQAVAARARAFGMRIVTNQHRPTPELYLEAGVEPLDLYDLLSESDFVTLHVPARPDTEGLIGTEELAAMKPTAYLVNTSRGPVVDEAALCQAIREGWVAGAALDVFEEEPLRPGNPLLDLDPDRVILTPHAIGANRVMRDTGTTMAVDNMLRALRGDLPKNIVNPEAIPAWRTRFDGP
jgi:D-3-phosphoglycerate dehydrogenase